MLLQPIRDRKISIAVAAAVLAVCLTGAAGAVTQPVTPATTQEWSIDIVRITASDPGTVSVGPSGAAMENGSGGSGSGTSSASRRRPGAKPADTSSAADYCLELDLADNSSGPYRVRFFFADGSGGDSSSAIQRGRGVRRGSLRHRAAPQDDTLSLTFQLDTSADGTVSTGGDTGLIGAIYDASDDLVASDDDSGDRIAATLASGSYTLVLSGGDLLAGDYFVVADQATCDE
jgi:hypothetical protein